jgi:hypothetical protein
MRTGQILKVKVVARAQDTVMRPWICQLAVNHVEARQDLQSEKKEMTVVDLAMTSRSAMLMTEKRGEKDGNILQSGKDVVPLVMISIADCRLESQPSSIRDGVGW